MEPLQEVVLAILLRGTRVLLVKRVKQEVGKSGIVLAWGFPGGKIELGESPRAAVVREVYEETGYRVTVERKISERLHPDFPVRAQYFLCACATLEPEAVEDRGTSEARWIETCEVGSYVSSQLESAVEAVLHHASG